MNPAANCRRCAQPLAPDNAGPTCARCLFTAVAIDRAANAYEIDRFELVTRISQGGMAVVHLAEQLEPVEREVAVKILKPGLDDEQILARFKAEQQTLAMMDHPHIAHVFDAGLTRSNRPYFAMEFVDGPTITEWCRLHKIPIKVRVKVVIEVCRALHHAHQKGIIHRDLKPSNILVGELDGRPAPKIIDFGIAKALQRRAVDRLYETRPGQAIGTPLYMSPEQATASPDIDIRSDIYSLGLVLFEVFTGKQPFADLEDAATAELMAGVYKTTIPELRERFRNACEDIDAEHAVADELEWITLRCLEKDRTKRYTSAEELAIDLERFLADQPVGAGPLTRWYQLSKFSRRNRVAITATAAVIWALVTGLSVSLWQARAARAARDKAERLVTLLTELFQAPDPENQGKDVKVVDVLVSAEEKLAVELTDQPDLYAEMSLILSQTYYGLTYYDRAEKLLRKALSSSDQKRIQQQTNLKLQHLLGDVLQWCSKHPEAIDILNRALDQASHDPQRNSKIILQLHQSLGFSYKEIGKNAEAETHFNEAMKLLETTQPPSLVTLGTILLGLADCLDARGNEFGSLELTRRGVEMLEQSGRDRASLAIGLVNLGNQERSLGMYDDALNHLNQAFEINVSAFGTNNLDVAMSAISMARVYLDQSQLDVAEQNLRLALKIQTTVLPTNHVRFVDSWGTLGKLQTRRRQFIEAENTLNSAIRLASQTYTTNHWVYTALHVSLSSALTGQGRFREAENLLLDGYDTFRLKFGANDSRTVGALKNLTALYDAEVSGPARSEGRPLP